MASKGNKSRRRGKNNKKTQQRQQPSESATSYFPNEPRQRRPSVDSDSANSTTTSGTPTKTPPASSSLLSASPPSPSSSPSPSPSLSPSPSWKPTNSPIGDYPLPPLEMPFPEPAGQLDVAAQLAKDPLPRSLHSSLRRAAAYERVVKVEDAETRARALAEAKKEWLSWKS